ncbi:MAG: hypothetical protein QM783_19315 [Phycisphaerales bacterium]
MPKARSRKKKHDENDDLDNVPEGDAPGRGISIPQTPDALAEFVRKEMGVHVAPSALIDGSDGPLAYLVHSFFEGRFTILPDGSVIDHNETKTPRPPGDCVVWANRGGGKTFLGAIATALDMIFKPKIEIRILGGSAEQSRRMHEHLRAIFEREQFQHLLDGRSTDTRVRLISGSRRDPLPQRTQRPRRARPETPLRRGRPLRRGTLRAAQLVTRSRSPIPGPWGSEVLGVIEVLSTMHVPMGMMWTLTRESGRAQKWAPPPSPGSAGEGRGGGAFDEGAKLTEEAERPPHPPAQSRGHLLPQSREKGARILFKWGVVDSLEPCDLANDCDTCSLKEECGGKAKQRTKGGHMTIRDARAF